MNVEHRITDAEPEDVQLQRCQRFSEDLNLDTEQKTKYFIGKNAMRSKKTIYCIALWTNFKRFKRNFNQCKSRGCDPTKLHRTIYFVSYI